MLGFYQVNFNFFPSTQALSFCTEGLTFYSRGRFILMCPFGFLSLTPHLPVWPPPRYNTHHLSLLQARGTGTWLSGQDLNRLQGLQQKAKGEGEQAEGGRAWKRELDGFLGKPWPGKTSLQWCRRKGGKIVCLRVSGCIDAIPCYIIMHTHISSGKHPSPLTLRRKNIGTGWFCPWVSESFCWRLVWLLTVHVLISWGQG